MADLSEVTAYLAQQAAAAVYPNGTSQASIADIDCIVFEGWPLAAQLELDLQGMMQSPVQGQAPVPRPGGKRANISIFQQAGMVGVYQILNHTYTITPPAIDLTFELSGDTITVANEPATGEYLTVVADDAHVYSRSGASTAAILAALAVDAQADYPSATTTATTLTIPVKFSMVVRQGGVATLGRVTHRQRHQVMVTVWAPTAAIRAKLASAIDNLIKTKIRVTMPDGSQAVVCYNRTFTQDDQQTVNIYRRDLIYDVEYATVEQFPGYVITSTQVSIAKPDNAAIATATT